MDRNLQKYQAFVAAAEQGNITKAAQRLSFSQSSVSKMISDLEKEWNVRLLERSRSGVRLTQEGEALIPGVRALLLSCEQLEAKVAEMNGIESGRIRIGVFSSVAEHWMPALVADYHREHPGIEYELLTGDYEEIEAWLEEGRIDCGFLRLPTKKTLDAEPLARDAYVAVLPQDHPFCRKKAVRPEDLNDQPFLLLEHGGKTEVTEFIEKWHLHPHIQFSTWDDYSIMAMAESGQGIALLPRLILRRIPYKVEIRPLTVDFYRTIGVAVKDRKNLSRAAAGFLSSLKKKKDLFV